MVGILVFQGGDWDDVYAIGALVGSVTRDFIIAIKADFISVCHEMRDCIPAEWAMIRKYRRGLL